MWSHLVNLNFSNTIKRYAKDIVCGWVYVWLLSNFFRMNLKFEDDFDISPCNLHLSRWSWVFWSSLLHTDLEYFYHYLSRLITISLGWSWVFNVSLNDCIKGEIFQILPPLNMTPPKHPPSFLMWSNLWHLKHLYLNF